MDRSILKSHHLKDTLTHNPWDRSFYQSFMNKDKSEWLELRDKILVYMEDQLIEVDGKKYLPKGTMLYHGSLKHPFLSDLKNKMTFFGLDTSISIWYILELIQNLSSLLKKQYPRFGYLYAFRLKKDLPVTKIIKTIHENPKEFLHCRMNNKSVCIGPQSNSRGNFREGVPDLYNISIELTFFYNYYKDYLELDSVYLVDPLALKLHDEDIDFEPQEAILQKIDEYKPEYNQKIDKETFYRYFIDDKNEFLCEYGCGYRGEYQDVLEHEKTCKYKQKGSGKHSRKKILTEKKYKKLIQQKKKGKLSKKNKKILDRTLKKKLCKCIKGIKARNYRNNNKPSNKRSNKPSNSNKRSNSNNKRSKKGSEYPICLSSIYTKRGFKPPKRAIKGCKNN